MWKTDCQKGASVSGLNVQIFGKLSLLMFVKFLNCSDVTGGLRPQDHIFRNNDSPISSLTQFLSL